MTFKRAVFIILVIVISLAAVSCSKTDKPEDTFKEYVEGWQNKDFTSMYQLLSKNAKEYISLDDFVQRYEKIYNGIEAENFTIAFSVNQDKKENEIPVSFTLAMDTIAGTIDSSYQTTLIQEGEGKDKSWGIQWDESMIFSQMGQGDVIKVETIPAQRGEIYDRNGKSLAKNGEIYTVGIQPKDLENRGEMVKERLAKEFNISIQDIDNKLNASWVKEDHFVPIGSLPIDELDKVKELTSLPGVLSQKTPGRVYPFKESTAHLIGYVAAINSEELKELEDKGYNQDSTIGKTGIELIYEDKLRPIDGKIIKIVDQDNNIKDTIAKQEARDGENIELTIDGSLQKRIYSEMSGEEGTAAAIHPDTGEVLSLVNSPSFDPNIFVLGLSDKEWKTLNEDVRNPLLNRFSQTYSPGSTFKPVTAAIAIDQKTLNEDKAIRISGLKWQKDRSWGDYYIKRVKDIGKAISLREALIYSDNIYFAIAALDLGENSFVEGGKKFGIGEEIPFSYGIKSSQITREGKFSGEIQLADSGYGQGQVSLSPLHLSTIYSAFLNEGNILKPILNIEDLKEGPKYWKENSISKETAELIKRYLLEVVDHPEGTGRKAKTKGLNIGGKTGTAELKTGQGEDGEENGWFVAFEESKIIITMMLENIKGQGGSAYVVPKVKEILESYLR